MGLEVPRDNRDHQPFKTTLGPTNLTKKRVNRAPWCTQRARPPRKTWWGGAPDKQTEHIPIGSWYFWTSKRHNLYFD